MSTFSKPSFAFAPTQNPFQAEPSPIAAAVAVAAAGESSYVFLPQGPRVSPEEVETLASAVEVQVLWGTTVLSVAHVEAGKGFAVGSVDGVDFVLPAEALGRERLALVSAVGGAAKLLVPEDATVTIGSESPLAASELLSQGRASVSQNGERGLEVAIVEEQSVRVGLKGSEIAYVVRGVRAGRAPAAAGFLAAISGTVSKYVGLSLVGHLGVIASLAYFMPSMGPDDAEATTRENFLLMQKMLNASAPAELKEQEATGGETAKESGGTGERAQGAEGTMGRPTAAASNSRWAFKGESKNPQVQQKTDLELARQFGMVDLLLTSKAGPSTLDPNAPAAKWGAFAAEGADAKSAMGNMWGTSIGDSLGGGAFGLSGNEEGGGGLGAGIGLDRAGLGHGNGGGDGNGFGPGRGGVGNSTGHIGGTHAPKGPRPIREGRPEVGGHLGAEVIQRVVRANFGRFRNCYEQGLRANPGLTGRVTTKFMIGRDGAVTVSADGGSDLPDAAVVSCVVRSFQSLSFPSPQGGQVTVTYPLSFTPE